MENLKHGIPHIILMAVIIVIAGCTPTVWYDAHGIDPADFYSEKSVDSYRVVLQGESLQDMRKVSRIIRNLRIKDDEIARLLLEKSITYSDDYLLINATAHLVNNQYYEYALRAARKGLCAYSNRTRLWFARQTGNIAQKTDATALLPLLKEMAVPGNDKREIQIHVRNAIRVIEYSKYKTGKVVGL